MIVLFFRIKVYDMYLFLILFYTVVLGQQIHAFILYVMFSALKIVLETC